MLFVALVVVVVVVVAERWLWVMIRAGTDKKEDPLRVYGLDNEYNCCRVQACSIFVIVASDTKIMARILERLLSSNLNNQLII